MKNEKRAAGCRVLIPALITMALWGSLFPCVKLGYNAFELDISHIPSLLLFAGVRFIICGAVLLCADAIDSRSLSFPARTTIGPVLLVGLFSIVLHYSFTYIGLSMNAGSKTAILKQIGSLFIISFAFLFNREDRFSMRKILGGVLGFISIVIINLDGLNFSFNVGDELIILASFCSVATGVVAKRAYRTSRPIFITAWSQLFGGLFLTAAGMLMGGSIPTVSLRAVLILGYICTASIIAYAFWNILIKDNDLSGMFMIKFTEPLFAALFSALLIHENIFRLTYLVSFVLVCLGIMFSTRGKRSDTVLNGIRNQERQPVRTGLEGC